MKKLVWAAGILLLLSIVFPNGIKLPPINVRKPEPVAPAPDVPDSEKDAKIVELLKDASVADRARISDVYSAAAIVTRRDREKGLRLNTTEKWAEYQARMLQLAIDSPGKYPGLDDAIESVFARKIGTDDVLTVTDEVSERLASACDIIAASAR